MSKKKKKKKICEIIVSKTNYGYTIDAKLSNNKNFMLVRIS